MENPPLNHDSPASLHAFLKKRGLAPRKRWGQNFLINPGARKKILNLLQPEPGSRVWEIGPGLGSMTAMLLERETQVTAFEIDPSYADWLEESLGTGSLEIIRGDVMRTWREVWQQQPPQRLLGNLPYNAASAIIADFIESDHLPPLMVFTVQDEMGQRMTAEPGSKAYSSFSVLCRSSAVIKDEGRLLPGSFWPAPRVRSRIVSLRPGNPWGPIHSRRLFSQVVRGFFSSRRKTLKNNMGAVCRGGGASLTPSLLQEAFAQADLDMGRRPETLTPGDWVKVVNLLTPGGDP